MFIFETSFLNIILFKIQEKQDEDEKEKDETEENKSKDEVLYIPDVGFSVKIVSPGSEPFDIQVSALKILKIIRHRMNLKYVRTWGALVFRRSIIS